jgi:cytochrome c oxidase subunit 3
MWYWHFVDIVWIALFIIVYLWGSWHTPNTIPSFLL